MHLFFKHMAFRTWITAGLGIPLSLILIPRISSVLPSSSPPMIYSFLICILFILTGTAMHSIAVQCIKGFIREGQKWERKANQSRCEATLLKALTVYNTGFLIPWKKKETVKKLTGAMARFALAHDKNAPVFIKATKYFLKKYPHETDIAAQWLKKDAFFSFHDPDDATLLTLLAKTHREDYYLLPLLAHRFLACRRSDFEARNLYASCIEAHVLSAAIYEKILELIPEIADTNEFSINGPPDGDSIQNYPGPNHTLGQIKTPGHIKVK